MRDHSFGGLTHVIGAAFPELRSRSELVALLWRDLTESGLVSGGGLGVTMSGAGLVQKRSTIFGDQVLEFISKPEIIQQA